MTKSDEELSDESTAEVDEEEALTNKKRLALLLLLLPIPILGIGRRDEEEEEWEEQMDFGEVNKLLPEKQQPSDAIGFLSLFLDCLLFFFFF